MQGKRENFSRKRAAILAALRGTTQHPTAEGVFNSLKPQYPDLSLATVYRNLNRLCETGQAASLGVIGGYERFDGELTPHAHLVCAGCGRVVDVFRGLPGQAQLDAVSGETGCRVQGVSVLYTGLCPDCIPKEEQDGTAEDQL
ncbi:Fur family transcriptional regulator [Acutalibacter caecimuris]|uniref:Fur family transcriptional regulator n=1 Tax=Acutalibacter caecimuris TaxID=3093657 RepID=UPI002AC8C261|nr:transcriptional repressor [Acutalibacter sp. M00118]